METEKILIAQYTRVHDEVAVPFADALIDVCQKNSGIVRASATPPELLHGDWIGSGVLIVEFRSEALLETLLESRSWKATIQELKQAFEFSIIIADRKSALVRDAML